MKAAGQSLAFRRSVYRWKCIPSRDYKAATTAADRSKAPAFGTPPELKLPEAAARDAFQRAEGDSGRATRGAAGELSGWTSDAGYAADQSAAPGTAKHDDGVADRRHENAQRAADQRRAGAAGRADCSAFSNLDFSFVRLSALKSKLDPSLELYADVILNPSFPEADFKREQKLQSLESSGRKRRRYRWRLRVFPALLYGEGTHTETH